MKYAGLVYYEEKGVEDLVTFTAAKDLKALVQVSECVCVFNGFMSCNIVSSLLNKDI